MAIKLPSSRYERTLVSTSELSRLLNAPESRMLRAIRVGAQMTGSGGLGFMQDELRVGTALSDLNLTVVPEPATWALLWRAANGPVLEKELIFHPGRLWRADFAFTSRPARLSKSRAESVAFFRVRLSTSPGPAARLP